MKAMGGYPRGHLDESGEGAERFNEAAVGLEGGQVDPAARGLAVLHDEAAERH